MGERIEFPQTNIDINKLKAKYKGTDKEKVMNTIFDRMDAFDQMIHRFDEHDIEYQDGIIELGSDSFESDVNSLMEKDEYSIKRIKTMLGDGVSYEDVENAVNDILTVGKQQVQDYTKDYPEAVKKHILHTDNKVKTIQKNGQIYYEITREKGVWTEIFTVDINGYVKTAEYGNGSDIVMNGSSIKFLLDENINISNSRYCNVSHSQGYIENLGNGITEFADFKTGNFTRKYGKTSFRYHVNGDINRGSTKKWHKDKTLDSITVNEGLVNQTRMNFIFDKNGKISDIKFNAEQNDTLTSSGERAQCVKMTL